MFGNFDYIRKLSYRQYLIERGDDFFMTKIERKNTSYAYKQYLKLKKKHKKTDYQVSKDSNGAISTAVLSQWGRGDYDLKLEKLVLLAKVFDVSVSEFIKE